MQATYTLPDSLDEKYVYPKSPFNSLAEEVEYCDLFKHTHTPALWTGNRIIPFIYDADSETISIEPLCNYCYITHDDWRIMGGSIILLDIDSSASFKSSLVVCHTYPYHDDDLMHKNIHRVVYNTELLIPFKEKVIAPDGMLFHCVGNAPTPKAVLEKSLGDKYNETSKFRIQIVDKVPDYTQEICHDVLAKEMMDIMDKETIQHILYNMPKEDK